MNWCSCSLKRHIGSPVNNSYIKTHKIPNTIQFLPFRFHDLHNLAILNIGVKKFRSTQIPTYLLYLQHLTAYLKMKYPSTALKRKDLKMNA